MSRGNSKKGRMREEGIGKEARRSKRRKYGRRKEWARKWGKDVSKKDARR